MAATCPAGTAAALKRYVTGAATVKVDWALDGPIPWANPEVAGAGTVHVARRRATSSCARSSQAHDGLADHPFLLLGQQSVADPTRAPEGKHTAWAYTHGPQQGVDWPASTPLVAERMEEQVERFAPGFRDRILARHVLGPGRPRGAATRTSWAATSAAAATGCARSSSARSRSCRRTRRR